MSEMRTRRVPRSYLPQMEEIRKSGQANMFDRMQVGVIATLKGYKDLAGWIARYPKDYGVLLDKFSEWKKEHPDKTE